MKKESFVIGQKQCVIYHDDKPEYILLQPVNDHEMENLDRQVSLIKAEVSESLAVNCGAVESGVITVERAACLWAGELWRGCRRNAAIYQ